MVTGSSGPESRSPVVPAQNSSGRCVDTLGCLSAHARAAGVSTRAELKRPRQAHPGKERTQTLQSAWVPGGREVQSSAQHSASQQHRCGDAQPDRYAKSFQCHRFDLLNCRDRRGGGYAFAAANVPEPVLDERSGRSATALRGARWSRSSSVRSPRSPAWQLRRRMQPARQSSCSLLHGPTFLTLILLCNMKFCQSVLFPAGDRL